MKQYIVIRGKKPWQGISLITDEKKYAEGFAAGVNHCSKKYWHRVEEVEPIPAGTPVRYWSGPREGEGRESKIRFDRLSMIGGTVGQYVTGAGFIAMTHIETINKENTK